MYRLTDETFRGKPDRETVPMANQQPLLTCLSVCNKFFFLCAEQESHS
jgi:hypothetical protein